MGMVKFDAYTLLLQGEDVLDFLDGLSTNLVSQSCTTVLTDRAAKIIDVCDVIVIDKRVALVGYGPNKTAVLEHFSKRLLGRQISFTDISHLNHVYIGIDDDERPAGVTVHQSHFGTMYVVPTSSDYTATWDDDAWNEHRIEHCIPFHGHEISSSLHPLACGLGDLVHPNKGCYIGQEILTRMQSRGRQGYRLVVRSNPAENVTTQGSTMSLCIVRAQ